MGCALATRERVLEVFPCERIDALVTRDRRRRMNNLALGKHPSAGLDLKK
jgi:hypothetical protein